jgi:hypothetical protein
MVQENPSPSESPAARMRDSKRDELNETFTDEELDALEQLTRFETEHRRMLAMQALYYRRHGARDVG